MSIAMLTSLLVVIKGV